MPFFTFPPLRLRLAEYYLYAENGGRPLARIIDGICEGHFKFLLVDPLRTFIQNGSVNFDWTKMAEYPGLLTIYSSLSQLGLQQAGVESYGLLNVTGHQPHPVPRGTHVSEGTQLWSEDMGRVCKAHDDCQSRNLPPFVGIGCTSAFSGNCISQYDNPNDAPCLPLVGPDDVNNLSDSEEWDIKQEWTQRCVTFDEAKTNIKLMGGKLNKPSGSSHYQVQFSGGRTWPLDVNFREVPDQYLRQLVSITGIEIGVIKYILCMGKFPHKKNKLRN